MSYALQNERTRLGLQRLLEIYGNVPLSEALSAYRSALEVDEWAPEIFGMWRITKLDGHSLIQDHLDALAYQDATKEEPNDQ